MGFFISVTPFWKNQRVRLPLAIGVVAAHVCGGRKCCVKYLALKKRTWAGNGFKYIIYQPKSELPILDKTFNKVVKCWRTRTELENNPQSLFSQQEFPFPNLFSKVLWLVTRSVFLREIGPKKYKDLICGAEFSDFYLTIFRFLPECCFRKVCLVVCPEEKSCENVVDHGATF